MTSGNWLFGICVENTVRITSVFNAFSTQIRQVQKRGRYGKTILENLKMKQWIQFDPNTPCGSRVMSLFTNWPQPARRMLSKISSTTKSISHVSCSIMSTCIYMQNLIQIYHMVKEARAFQLTEHGRTDSHSDYSAHLRVIQSQYNHRSSKIWCDLIII